MSHKWLFGRLIAVLMIAGLPTVAFGQALADRVPADAIIYVGWRGENSLGPGFEGSNFKKVLDQSQIPQFIDEFLPALADRVAKEHPDTAQAIGVFRSVVGPMWRHPSAFFFAGVDFTNPNQPMPHVGLLCDAGDEAAALEKQVQGLLQNVGNIPVPINVVRSGNLVAVLAGYSNPQAALPGGQGGGAALSADANFTQALGEVSKDAVGTGYINFEALFGLIDRVVQMAAPPEAQQAWPKIEDGLGLRGLKRMIFTQGFDGPEWGTRVFVSAPEPRQGLLAMLDQAKPLSNEIYSTIPENVRMAGATHFDVGELVSAIQRAAAQVDPNIGQMIDSVFQQVSQTVGVDVRKDFFGSLGNEWSFYIDPKVMGRSMLGMTVVNHLKDPAKAEESILKVEQFITSTISQQLDQQKPKMSLSVEQIHSGDVTIHYLGTPFVAPAWAVSNGNLYIGLYPQVVAAAAVQGAGHGHSILNNTSFTNLRQKLGGENATSFQYMDLPNLMPDSYGAWVAISRAGGFGDLFGVPAPPLVLPTLDKIMPYVSPSGAVRWVDAKGAHARAIEPFPGSELLSSDPLAFGPAQEAMMVSIMLPALNKAREQANRVKSASNLRQIGLGALMYADKQNGSLPPDLGTLFNSEDLPPAILINPRGKNSLPPNIGSMSKEQLKQWADQSSDYMWFGSGKKNTDGANVLIASEKPEGMSDGVNMLFGDGHVEFVAPISEAENRIRQAESGRPPRIAPRARGRGRRGAGAPGR